MTRTDGTEQWLRLVIFDVSTAGDGARFKFTINSLSYRYDGEGTLARRDNVVQLADMSGVLETRSDGYLVIHSAVTGLRPRWSFTSNRSLIARNRALE